MFSSCTGLSLRSLIEESVGSSQLSVICEGVTWYHTKLLSGEDEDG